MKISYRGDYALKAILDLALNYGNGLVKIQDISKRQDIPLKYLEQILLTLKGAGYVKSERGARGGYRLAKGPKQIKMGEIIRLMEGPVSPITCVSHSCYKKCSEESRCAFRPIFDKIRIMTEDIVDRMDFAQMCRIQKEKDNRKLSMYYI
jgi:Rrf2 family protein